ncbi:Uncharacterised protein [uncultured archaeon]|nr:Uncharacterised protein [uncultured archaeon]
MSEKEKKKVAESARKAPSKGKLQELIGEIEQSLEDVSSDLEGDEFDNDERINLEKVLRRVHEQVENKAVKTALLSVGELKIVLKAHLADTRKYPDNLTSEEYTVFSAIADRLKLPHDLPLSTAAELVLTMLNQ